MIDIKALSAPFPPEAVHWRVGATNADKTKGMALAYLDARDVMERLDAVCGPENWQRRYVDAGNGKTCCEIGILFRLIDTGGPRLEWIWKADGAGDTDTEGDKGAFSDAFKRAAVTWGVGRYLYDLKSPWVEIEKRGNSHVIKDNQYRLLENLLGQQARGSEAVFDAAKIAIEKAETLMNLKEVWERNWAVVTAECNDQQISALTEAKDIRKQTLTEKEAA